MTTSLYEEKRLDVPPEQRRTADLVKHICKLRWIGMEEEAAKLQLALAFFPSAERAILLPSPCDTDSRRSNWGAARWARPGRFDWCGIGLS
jgi:hypothetical protein